MATSAMHDNLIDAWQLKKSRTHLVAGRFAGTRPAGSVAYLESGPLGAVHFSRHKWPGGLVN